MSGPATTVTRLADDSDSPVVGRILGWEDDARVLVAWGDAALSPDPWESARVEYADDLMPVNRRTTWT